MNWKARFLWVHINELDLLFYNLKIEKLRIEFEDVIFHIYPIGSERLWVVGRSIQSTESKEADWSGFTGQ